MRPGVVLSVALLLTGCGGAADPAGADAEMLTVYAAASLATTFETLAERFERDHDVDVRLALGGSTDLASQIQQGAPADVFAAADEATMRSLTDSGLAEAPRLFARNTLRLVVPAGNPAGVTRLADVADPEVRLVVCAPAVPCGAATQRLADRQGVALQPVSEEQSVAGVIDKVRTGEADAGLVYATDVAAAEGEVATVEVPGVDEVVNRYPIAVLDRTDSPHAAQQFVDLVLSDEGLAVLTSAGFGRP